MSWLVEGSWVVYLVLGLIAAAAFFLYWQNRDRKFLVLGSILLAAAVIYLLLDLFVETAGEQIERKVRAMARAVAAKNADGVVEHLSEDFRVQYFDKKAIRAQADLSMKKNEVQSVEVWEFESSVEPDVQTLIAMNLKEEDAQARVRDHTALEGTFKAKPKGEFTGDAAFYYIRAIFVRDPDGQWRLRTFQVQHPVTRELIHLKF